MKPGEVGIINAGVSAFGRVVGYYVGSVTGIAAVGFTSYALCQALLPQNMPFREAFIYIIPALACAGLIASYIYLPQYTIFPMGKAGEFVADIIFNITGGTLYYTCSTLLSAILNIPSMYRWVAAVIPELALAISTPPLSLGIVGIGNIVGAYFGYQGVSDLLTADNSNNERGALVNALKAHPYLTYLPFIAAPIIPVIGSFTLITSPLTMVIAASVGAACTGLFSGAVARDMKSVLEGGTKKLPLTDVAISTIAPIKALLDKIGEISGRNIPHN